MYTHPESELGDEITDAKSLENLKFVRDLVTEHKAGLSNSAWERLQVRLDERREELEGEAKAEGKAEQASLTA